MPDIIPQYNEENEYLYMEDGEYKVISKADAEQRGWRVGPGYFEPLKFEKRYSKRMLFGSLSDAEYAIWEQVEAQQTPRRRRMLQEAVELNESDEDFPDLYIAMVAAYGQARADELLEKALLA